jgi:hypothetical protein
MRRLLPALFFVCFALDAVAATRPKRVEIWDLEFGAKVDAIPDEFVDYACGSNGGAPSAPLKGFSDFKRCRPEASGLREVYFRYDDELEYWAKANNLQAEMEQYAGTKTYGFPVVTSILVGEDGVMKGIRIISDPRYDSNREEAYFLKNFLSARLGRDGWSCEDLKPEEGETPVDGVFFKQRCEKDLGERVAKMEARHLRKAGQARYDPRSGRQTTNQFESVVRFEIVVK